MVALRVKTQLHIRKHSNILENTLQILCFLKCCCVLTLRATVGVVCRTK